MMLCPAWAHAGELQVVVTNVRNAHGHVVVGVCSVERFLTGDCEFNASAKAQPGETVVIVPNVAPGIWAVQAFLDENDNEEVDRDLIGIPTEGIGFSNNAPFRFGPPKFQNAAFQLALGGGRITLRLRYLIN